MSGRPAPVLRVLGVGAGLLLLLSVLAGLAGCQSLVGPPSVDIVLPTQALPAAAAAAVPAGSPTPSQPSAPPNGAIFQATRYRPMFENHRARLVGDLVTITIAEKVTAAQSSTSTIDRAGTTSAGITSLPLLGTSGMAKLGAEAQSANTFSGKGKSENSNNFSGSITATVVQVLPNGHLVVSAEKQIGVNASVDVLRFSGQIDPAQIAPGNTVVSTSVANVRIEQRGRGQLPESQAMGWLQRFFINVLPI
ncbi:MAG: hypothetical protein RLY78_3154 [Pseudomonadota bacterium]